LNNNKKMAERKQVNLNLGKVSATPSMQAVGGTNQVAVQTVLKDNAAMRLSRSLSQFSNILGQTSNINMQLGKEAAEKLTSQEINDIIEGKVPAPTGGALGKLGFQKAFHQIAAKRWFDTTGVQQYADLQNKIDSQMDIFIKNSVPIEQVQEYVQNEVNALDKDINKYFEGNTFGTRVKNLLGSELSSRIITGATNGYEKKQLDYMRAANQEQRTNEFARVVIGESEESLKGYFSRVQKLYTEEGYSGQEINSLFNSTFIKGLELAMATDPDIASGMIRQAKNLTINGKPAFGSMEARLQMALARGKISKIRQAEQDSGSFTDADLRKQFSAPVGTFFKILKRHNDNNESPPKDGTAYTYLLDGFSALDINGGLTEAGIDPEKLATTVMSYDNPRKGFRDIVAEISKNESLDPKTRSILRIAQADINEEIRRINEAPPEVFIGLSVGEKKALREEAKAYFRDNPINDEKAFMRAKGLGEMDAPIGVMQEYEKANLINKNIPSKVTLNGLLDKEISDVSEDPNLSLVFKGDKETAAAFTKDYLNGIKEQSILRIVSDLRKFAEDNIEEGTPNKEQVMYNQAAILVKEETKDLRLQATVLQVRREEDFGDTGFAAETDPQKIKANRVERMLSFKLSEDDDSDDSPFFTKGKFGNVVDNLKLKPYKTLNREYAQTLSKGERILTDVKTRKEINTDFKKAREAEDDDALELLMQFYGYKTIDFTKKDIIKDFDATDLWWTDVSLFENIEELNNTVKMFFGLMEKVEKDADLTEDEKNKLSVMADLGIYDLTEKSKFLTNFEAVQIELLTSDK